MSDENTTPKVEQPTVESTADVEPVTAEKPTEAVDAADVDKSTTVDKVAEAATDKIEEPAATEKPSEVATTESTTETVLDNKNDDSSKTTVDQKTEDTSTKPHHNNEKHNFKKNKKSNPEVLPETDDPAEIRKQVDFYFSDSNLGRDQYLWSLTGGPENKPVPLKTICSFNRMRRFKPHSAIVAALRDSKEVNIAGEDGEEQITRKTPYDSTTLQNAVVRSVYVKGFGEEEHGTQFEIEAWFSQFNHEVAMIKLRRDHHENFKGSVFVEFKTEEEAKAFVALDPAPKFKGNDMKIMSKLAYMEEKEKLIKEGKIKRHENDEFFEGRGGRGKGRGGGRFPNKSHNSDPNDWKARKAEDRKGGGYGGGGRGRGGRGRGGRGRGGHGRGGRDRDDRKRSRDDDGANEDRPAKKVDAKAE